MILSYLHKAGSPIYCNAHSVKSISHIISCLKHLWIYICKSKERVCKMRSVGDPFPSLSIQATSFMWLARPSSLICNQSQTGQWEAQERASTNTSRKKLPFLCLAWHHRQQSWDPRMLPATEEINHTHTQHIIKHRDEGWRRREGIGKDERGERGQRRRN